MQNLFKTIRVIEFSNVLAGPAVGMFFAELGAKVIKIENKLAGGDITRKWKLPSEKQNTPSAYYSSVNWGKKSLFLDLTSTKDKKKAIALIRSSDILISNYKSGDAKKLGLDYTHIKKLNPRIIYAHISGFGENDKRLAFDLILQAETGYMSMNGTPESGPLKMPVALIDILTAHQLKEAILIALMNRLKTNKGCYVETSLYDSAIASLANQGANWLLAKHIPLRTGSLHPTIAPYGEIMTSKDKVSIVLAIGTNQQFEKLCATLNIPELATNPKFNTNSRRIKNRKKLCSILQKKFRSFTAQKIISKLISNQVPVAEIKNLKKVFSNKLVRKMILTKKQHPVALKTIAFRIKP
ncbi:MAG: CoA transferase [Bacteroidia bacterium]|nr:CoA transferase [Bacteroidia bacterium]